MVLGRKRGYPDVHYKEQNVLVHLDGRIGHTDSLDKWADFERDLSQSRKIDLESWRSRPLLTRGQEKLWSLFGEIF